MLSVPFTLLYSYLLDPSFSTNDISATSPEQPSPLRIALSGIAGSTSLACWFVLLLPQLIEQWRFKSADGISIQFLIMWFLGDIFNLMGALLAGLLPQVVLLAVWFCVADSAILSSYYYYTYIYPKSHPHHHHNHHHHNQIHNDTQQQQVSETSPLLSATQASEDAPSDRRRSSHRSTRSHKSRRNSTLSDVILQPEEYSVFVRFILPLIFVILAGFAGFFFSGKIVNKPDNNGGDDDIIDKPKHGNIDLYAQIFGYASAFLYLTARLPQIYQNYRKKSCEGLSLLFFMFSTLGNITYGLQILFFRNDYKYVLLNLSWLLGSIGTIFEDGIIFAQFYLYKKHKTHSSVFDEEV
ncbi:unnamed protein product [[Candida] boidinii]|uniref:Unnamed protein product n=1 Tax=Candida boidinii TaxID=5477 RepID=A0A9W6SZN6_CANBO|nr:hypothetical protein B5S30_g2068 [[Candida] boidinii]OWB82321.1 hypothetical protein B5S33_g945 [[Candida] boidinii]GME71293.1 unnamed protein product [[Candida] boidinii]